MKRFLFIAAATVIVAACSQNGGVDPVDASISVKGTSDKEAKIARTFNAPPGKIWVGPNGKNEQPGRVGNVTEGEGYVDVNCVPGLTYCWRITEGGKVLDINGLRGQSGGGTSTIDRISAVN